MTLSPNIPRRVVVTGIGVITPIGNTVDEFWDSLIHGRGGIGPITRFDTTEYAAHFAGQVKDFDPTEFIDYKEARHMDPFCHYAIAAAIQAVEDSSIEFL